jgi:hypothetical protein
MSIRLPGTEDRRKLVSRYNAALVCAYKFFMAVWDYPSMRRPDGRGRIVWAAFAALFCVASLHASHGKAVGPWSRFVAGTAAAPFRLGTAARPFAWSTAVGDLNGDGTLDYAVADHIGRDLAGFEYSIDLSISGLAAQRVTFSSPSAALSIALRDVDHDQDLDVVVSTVVQPGVVRIWLNDGSGTFAETGGFDTFTWQSAASLAPDSFGGTLGGLESTPRFGRDALETAGAAATNVAVRWMSSAWDDVPPASRLGDARRSRAPPSAVSLSL